MDLSKLPRLSKSEPPPPNEQAPDPVAAAPTRRCQQCGAPLRPGARFCDSCGAPAGGARRDDYELPGAGPEAWISVAIGVLLLLIFPAMLKFFAMKILHMHTGPFIDPETSQPVDYATFTDGSRRFYRDDPIFWSDLALTTFAFAMILEGVALIFSRRRSVVIVVFAVTVVATLGNLLYFLLTMKQGIALFSAVAFIVGSYMATYQWRLLMALRPPPIRAPNAPGN